MADLDINEIDQYLTNYHMDFFCTHCPEEIDPEKRFNICLGRNRSVMICGNCQSTYALQVRIVVVPNKSVGMLYVKELI